MIYFRVKKCTIGNIFKNYVQEQSRLHSVKFAAFFFLYAIFVLYL